MRRALILLAFSVMLSACSDETRWTNEEIITAMGECVARNSVSTDLETYCNCEVAALEEHTAFENRADAMKENVRLRQALRSCQSGDQSEIRDTPRSNRIPVFRHQDVKKER